MWLCSLCLGPSGPLHFNPPEAFPHAKCRVVWLGRHPRSPKALTYSDASVARSSLGSAHECTIFEGDSHSPCRPHAISRQTVTEGTRDTARHSYPIVPWRTTRPAAVTRRPEALPSFHFPCQSAPISPLPSKLINQILPALHHCWYPRAQGHLCSDLSPRLPTLPHPYISADHSNFLKQTGSSLLQSFLFEICASAPSCPRFKARGCHMDLALGTSSGLCLALP